MRQRHANLCIIGADFFSAPSQNDSSDCSGYRHHQNSNGWSYYRERVRFTARLDQSAFVHSERIGFLQGECPNCNNETATNSILVSCLVTSPKSGLNFCNIKQWLGMSCLKCLVSSAIWRSSNDLISMAQFIYVLKQMRFLWKWEIRA